MDVCEAAVEALPVTGAWAMAQAMAGHVMCVTDAVSEQLAELETTLGEGPCLEALACSSPVLVSDLDDEDGARRRPGFTPQARQVNVAAIFAAIRARRQRPAQRLRLWRVRHGAGLVAC